MTKFSRYVPGNFHGFGFGTKIALAMTQEAATTSPNPLGRIVVMDYRAPHRWALPRQLKAGHGRRPA
jgi:hypothetical protein